MGKISKSDATEAALSAVEEALRIDFGGRLDGRDFKKLIDLLFQFRESVIQLRFHVPNRLEGLFNLLLLLLKTLL